MNEYATSIANDNSSTYILLTEDFSTGMGPALKRKHINENAEFDELLLDSREGRRRLSYSYTMKSLAKYKFFKEKRERDQNHVFIIPYHLREAGATMKEWPEIIKGQYNYSHFIIDLRTPKQIED